LHSHFVSCYFSILLLSYFPKFYLNPTKYLYVHAFPLLIWQLFVLSSLKEFLMMLRHLYPRLQGFWFSSYIWHLRKLFNIFKGIQISILGTSGFKLIGIRISMRTTISSLGFKGVATKLGGCREIIWTKVCS